MPSNKILSPCRSKMVCSNEADVFNVFGMKAKNGADAISGTMVLFEIMPTSMN